MRDRYVMSSQQVMSEALGVRTKQNARFVKWDMRVDGGFVIR